MKDKNRVTFDRVDTGMFLVLLDGEKTEFEIYNGSRGLSGRDTNMYGIVNHKTGKVTWLGPLATCKKFATQILLKRAKAPIVKSVGDVLSAFPAGTPAGDAAADRKAEELVALRAKAFAAWDDHCADVKNDPEYAALHEKVTGEKVSK